MRRRDWQRGMTLVELLVSMFAMSIILVGLGGVLFDVSGHYQGWANRLNNASTGTALAADLQADSHRYVVCGVPGPQGQTLNLCPADDLDASSPAVRYTISTGGAPYLVVRQQANQPSTLLARGSGTTQPSFWVDCFDDGNSVSGHVHVYNLRLDDGAGGKTVSSENFSIYYAAPWRLGCT